MTYPNNVELSWKDFKNFPVSMNTTSWVDFINDCRNNGVELPQKMRSIQVLQRHPNQHPNIVANVYLSDATGNQWGFQAWKLDDSNGFEIPYCWREEWNILEISVTQMKEGWLKENGLQVMKNKRTTFAYRLAIAQFINILTKNDVKFQRRGVQKSWDGQDVVAKMVNIINTYHDVILKGEHTPKCESVEFIKGSIIPENPSVSLGKFMNIWITGESFPNQAKENLTDALATLKNEKVIKELYTDHSLVGNAVAAWGKDYLPTRTNQYDNDDFASFADVIISLGVNEGTREFLEKMSDKKRMVIVRGQNFLVEAGQELPF